MKQSAVIEELKSMLEEQIASATHFQTLDSTQLNWKTGEKSWNILECLEHLNLYGDFYLKSLETTILNAKPLHEDREYRPGWFGGPTAKSMLPKKSGKLMYTMDTFKDKNPILLGLPSTPIDRFIKQQKQFLTLLDAAKKVDLNKNRTPTTLPGIKFKLGDALRFVIYHQVRHMAQAHRVYRAQQS